MSAVATDVGAVIGERLPRLVAVEDVAYRTPQIVAFQLWGEDDKQVATYCVDLAGEFVCGVREVGVMILSDLVLEDFIAALLPLGGPR